MTIRSTLARRLAGRSQRRVLLVTGISLSFMALLASFAQFGVLKTLVVPGDAAATTNNIATSLGLFEAAIVAFLIVAILDVVVAWGFYALLRPVGGGLARLIGSLRVIYAAIFAIALVALVRAAQLVESGGPALQSGSLQAQVGSSITLFDTVWHLALGIFGLHLVGLGALLVRFTVPRLLAALVVLAGVGYLVDALGTMFIADYGLSVSTVTFVGEALLIVWLFWRVTRGSRSSEAVSGMSAQHIHRGDVMTPTGRADPLSSTTGGLQMNASPQTARSRSPFVAIAGSLLAGAVLALAAALLFSLVSDGSEPVVTGSVLLAFGLGWGLMTFLTTRFSGQPQRWMAVPATLLGAIGFGLIVIKPGSVAMDLVSWVWPPAIATLAVWMVVQVRLELRSRGRWFIFPVIAALLIFSVGGALTTISSATGTVDAVSTGRMIDVGGHRLYIECSGTGSPTVVLQSGLGESSSYWARIAPAVGGSTRVCVYDRASHGRSDEVPGPQDGIAIATDLHTLLERAGVARPFILVGHSSGGPYVRVFAARYPDEVVGMVLLDPQPADAFTALPDYPSQYQVIRMTFGLGPTLARIGLVGPFLGLPPDQSTVAATRGAADEINVLPLALQQAQALSSIGARPLFIVTALSGAQRGWANAHERMMALSTNAKHLVLATATHNSIITGDDSSVSLQAILAVVASIRAGAPLR